MTERRDGAERRHSVLTDLIAVKDKIFGMESDIKDIYRSLNASKVWLITTLVSIVGALLLTAGYLITQGGFAKATDLAEVKATVAIMSSTLSNHEKISDENNEILKRMEKNGRHK